MASLRPSLRVHPSAGVRSAHGAPSRALAWMGCIALALGHGVWLSSRLPSLFYHSEFWAEEASNFYVNAVTGSLWGNLQALDFAYVPLLPRLFVLFVHALPLAPATLPLAYHLVSLAWVSGCIAAFAAPTFRRLLPSDGARALLCLGLYFHPDFQMKTLLTASYYGALPLFLLALSLPVAELSLGATAALSVLGAVLGLSKPALFGFGPVFALLACALLCRRRWRPLAVSVSILLAFALQACIVAWHPHAAAAKAGISPRLLAKIVGEHLLLFPAANVLGGLKAFYPATSVPGALRGFAWPKLTADYVALVGAVCTLLAIARTLRTARLRRALRWPLAVTALCVGVCTTLTAASFPDAPWVYDATFSNLPCRWWFVPLTLTYLFFGILVARARRHAVGGSLVATALYLAVATPLSPRTSFHDENWPIVHVSTWQDLHLAGLDPNPRRLCLPVDPYPFALEEGCALLGEPRPFLAAAGARPLALPVDVPAPAAAADGVVDSVAVLIDPQQASYSVATALDASGAVLATAATAPAHHGRLTTFVFARPVAKVHRIALRDRRLSWAAGPLDADAFAMWFGQPVPQNHR